MNILPYGDQAVLVNFEEKIDIEINQKVHQLHQEILSENIDGITFCIPAYCSLTIGFDKQVVRFDALQKIITQLESKKDTNLLKKDKRKFNIPVCYHDDFFLDKKEVQNQTQLSTKEIIRFHTSPIYQVFMMGFLPGFAYLGKLPEELLCPRKSNPRKKVEKGTVAIAGLQTGVYPSDAPGGWQIIGKSPVLLFSPNNENPFLFQTGDQVSFQAVSKKEYLQLEKMIHRGELSNTDFFDFL